MKCKQFYDFTKINANDQLDLLGSCSSGCNNGNDFAYVYNLFMYDDVNNLWPPYTNNLNYFQTGRANSDLTILSDLFMGNPQQIIWKIELNVFSSTQNLTGYTSILLYVNFPPIPGSCNVDPLLGTTSTLFTLTCVGWFDSDGLLISYAFYGISLIFVNYLASV